MSSCSHSSSGLTILHRQLVSTLLLNIRDLTARKTLQKTGLWDRCFTEPFRSTRGTLWTSALWQYGDASRLMTSRLPSKWEEKTHINNSDSKWPSKRAKIQLKGTIHQRQERRKRLLPTAEFNLASFKEVIFEFFSKDEWGLDMRKPTGRRTLRSKGYKRNVAKRQGSVECAKYLEVTWSRGTRGETEKTRPVRLWPDRQQALEKGEWPGDRVDRRLWITLRGRGQAERTALGSWLDTVE